MMKAKKKFLPLTSKNVCQIYELLHSRGLVSFPLTRDAENKISSLISSINSSYFGREAYPTPEEKAVAYLYFIIKSHPFTDGNKRTASLSFETVCELNKLQPRYDDFALDELAVFVEQIKEQDNQFAIGVLASRLFYVKDSS